MTGCGKVNESFPSRVTANLRPQRWDDWAAFLAWPLGMYFLIVVSLQFTGQTAHHNIALMEYGTDACYYIGIFCVKASALCFYARVFRVKKSFNVALWIVGVFNFLAAIAIAGATTFYCIPARKVWEPSVPGHCVKLEPIFVAATVIAVVTDLVILIMPIYPLRDLKMSKNKRWGVFGVFALGYTYVTFGAGRWPGR